MTGKGKGGWFGGEKGRSAGVLFWFSVFRRIRLFDAEHGGAEAFERVMEAVTDAADGHSGAGGDTGVVEVVLEAEFHEFAVAGREVGEAEAKAGDGFGAFVAAVVVFGGEVGELFDGGAGFAAAEVIEGEAADGGDEPGAGLFDVSVTRVDAQEGVLDDVLRGGEIAGDAGGETEKPGLFGDEEVGERRATGQGRRRLRRKVGRGWKHGES
jgi:hypothetical protein